MTNEKKTKGGGETDYLFDKVLLSARHLFQTRRGWRHKEMTLSRPSFLSLKFKSSWV